VTVLPKNKFNDTQNGRELTHLTTVLKADLRRIWGECGYAGMAGAHTGGAQILGTVRHWPRSLSRLVPRTFSDNVLVIGRWPADSLGLVVDRWGE
jgi:hypothetical protein